MEKATIKWVAKNFFLKLFIIIFGIFIVIYIFQKIDLSTPERTSGSCDSGMKKAIANEYKSPSTVKFISCQWDKEKWIYWEADAENGFWAIIRTSFFCSWDSCLITNE